MSGVTVVCLILSIISCNQMSTSVKTSDYKGKSRTSHHYRKDTARKSNKTWKMPMNHQNMFQLCKEK